MTSLTHKFADNFDLLDAGSNRRHLDRLVTCITRWHQRARQRRQLAELEPRLLADIGISAEQARRESSKPFWQP